MRGGTDGEPRLDESPAPRRVDVDSTLLEFIAKRVLILALLLLGLSFAIFCLLYLAPGNAVDTLLGTRPRSPETVAALNAQYHLDEPFLTQYWLWLRDAIHLDFGTSVQTLLPVSEEIKARLPLSLFLGVYAFIVTMVVGLTLGTVAAFKRQGLLDRTVVSSSIVGLSTPAFVGGFFLLYVFAVRLGWFPTFGPGSGFTDRLWHLTLPAFALAFTTVAYVVKHLRASLINVIDQDYVTFARARGLSNNRVLYTYCLRNALIPVVTIAAPTLAYLITGAVLIESTFSLPGVGELLVRAATIKDIPVVQGVAMVFAVLIMTMNLVTDVAYVFIDPRIRLGGNS